MNEMFGRKESLKVGVLLVSLLLLMLSQSGCGLKKVSACVDDRCVAVGAGYKCIKVSEQEKFDNGFVGLQVCLLPCKEVDDCNGSSFEGWRCLVRTKLKNRSKVCFPCKGYKEEVCNGKDDNCDGAVDNVVGARKQSNRLCDRERGFVCQGEQGCVCKTGLKKCDENCVNVKESHQNCGVCGKACTNNQMCKDGICNLLRECKSGEIRECYEGRSGSKGVGVCKAGKQVCGGRGRWGTCLKEMKPSLEVCNGKDDDCDGKTDEGHLCGKGRACMYERCIVLPKCVMMGTCKCLALGSCVLIEAGHFLMGSPEMELCRSKDETQHKVTITYPYLMMKTEATQGQFIALMGYNPSYLFSGRTNYLPVQHLTWHEAVSFANAVSRAEGLEECFRCSGSKRKTVCKSKKKGLGYLKCKGWRLPSEAEWEYAYRAGTTTAFYSGRKVDCRRFPYKIDPNADKIAWFGENSGSLSEIGRKMPNKWGLYDMGGNVSEWVYDRYGLYKSQPVIDPIRDIGTEGVTRGGHMNSHSSEVRAASRIKNDFSYDATTGFRLVRQVQSKK